MVIKNKRKQLYFKDKQTAISIAAQLNGSCWKIGDASTSGYSYAVTFTPIEFNHIGTVELNFKLKKDKDLKKEKDK